ncbi:MAG: VanZ family protein [Romboutsia sp.]
MIQLNFITFVPITIVIWSLYRLYLSKSRQDLNLIKEGVLLILILYLLILIRLTIFKFCIVIFSNPLNSYQYSILGVKGIINIVPFKEIVNLFNSESAYSFVNIKHIILNVVYFLPLGFLIPLLFEKYNDFLKVIVISASISIAIEIAQLFTILSVSDIDDIICNIIGSILGLICFKVFERLVIKFKCNSIFSKIRY